MINCEIFVDNIKCGGCANNVVSTLSKIDGVSNVQVTIDEGKVNLDLENEETKASVLKKLASMGYPEAGTSTLMQKGKSYVSCMIGKVQS